MLMPIFLYNFCLYTFYLAYSSYKNFIWKGITKIQFEKKKKKKKKKKERKRKHKTNSSTTTNNINKIIKKI